jgi:hypothetical protein
VVDICTRFDGLPWHDARLIGYCVRPAQDGRTHEVVLEVQFRPGTRDGLKDVAVRFLDSTIFRADLDLEGKRVCDDSIATAHCMPDSDLKRELEEGPLKHEVKPLEGFLHFRILLIAPGGVIDIFARDFAVEPP